MIEVEKKLIVTPEEKARVIEGAEFISEKKFTDIYYDTGDFSLTRKDIWLRDRAGSFELKYPINEAKYKTQYEEFEDEDSIRKKLALPSDDRPLIETLKKLNYVPFATITTTRRKYRRREFTIDIDVADYGYEVMEIECMVNEKSEVDATLEKIILFAESCGLKNTRVALRGKVMEYISRKNPEQFAALERAWNMKL